MPAESGLGVPDADRRAALPRMSGVSNTEIAERSARSAGGDERRIAR
jgi:hypothetical protein